ncbi:helix-turn-helix domain-containing protein [Bifidobacterium sp. UBA6881]|uniref:helix-turn-helix domain-containing protein n=2 Tax=Bifidobacterium TaxID=1678 RepID=UPI0025C45DF5|nr:helix-turn-helix transcriptional regulator [Bifidobacterium sp. UBA6881]
MTIKVLQETLDVGMRYVPTAVRHSLRVLGRHASIQRKLLNLTLADVSQRAGVSINTVRNVESGKAVRTDSLFAILNILQLLGPAVDATDPYQTPLGMACAIDQLPQRVRR